MKAKRIAFLGVMGALAIAVSFLEGLFYIPFLPPGAKPGLSNVITVCAFFASGTWGAIYVAVVKSLFAFITRGGIAFILSFSGGLLSAFVMILLLKWKKCPFSIIGISVIGAIFHNTGQIVASVFVTQTVSLIYYMPALLIFSLVAGTVTGTVLKALEPLLKKAGRENYERNCDQNHKRGS